MVTTINNKERVFQVLTSTGDQVFCNLKELNKVVKELNTHEGYFKIFHFWNNRAQKATKKLVREMFEAAKLKQEFYY